MTSKTKGISSAQKYQCTKTIYLLQLYCSLTKVSIYIKFRTYNITVVAVNAEKDATYFGRKRFVISVEFIFRNGGCAQMKFYLQLGTSNFKRAKLLPVTKRMSSHKTNIWAIKHLGKKVMFSFIEKHHICFSLILDKTIYRYGNWSKLF